MRIVSRLEQQHRVLGNIQVFLKICQHILLLKLWGQPGDTSGLSVLHHLITHNNGDCSEQVLHFPVVVFISSQIPRAWWHQRAVRRWARF